MTRRKFEGLTGNERLFEIGKYDKFQEALHHRDAKTIEKILRQIEIGEEAIELMFKKHGITRLKKKDR